MKSVYLTIMYILLTISLVKGMSLMNDGTQHLERLLHKTMRYQHHRENYEESMRTGIVPKGLRIKKALAFEPVSKDFYIRWDEILCNAEKSLIELLLYESSKVVAKLEVDLSNGIRELYPDSYEDKRLEMERKEDVYSKNLEKTRLKKWKTLTESNSTFSKEIKEVEFNKSKNVIHNNTFIQRNSLEDSLSVEESTNKARFITDNRISTRKKKKAYAEVVESGNSSINEGKKCGKNCTIQRQDALGRKDAFEAASTPTKTCDKPLLNENVPQCVDILNKTVVDPLLDKELLVASKDSNIRVIDKTSLQVGKSFVDFEAIKRDLFSGENSFKISNKPPVVCTDTSVVQKNYDVNTSSDIRLTSTQDMELLEILEELQNSNEIISSDSSCDVISDKRFKGYFCSDTGFNLRGRVLSESEIKVLEKG